MIRFRRLIDPATDLNPRQRSDILEIFRQGFPAYRKYAQSLLDAAAGGAHLDHDVVLMLAEDGRSAVLGFALAYYFAELRLGYIVYIASAPQRPARGIGGALYEATRELLSLKGARGLLLEVESDDPALVGDPETLRHNRRRIRFYERYGVLPVEGTAYATALAESGLGPPLLLLHDPLGKPAPLRRAEARRAVERIFGAVYGKPATDPLVRRIADSFRDDPVRRRSAPVPTDRAPVIGSRVRPIALVVAEGAQIRHLRDRGFAERPVRVDAVLAGLDGLPVERCPARGFGIESLTAIHDAGMIGYLERLSARLKPDDVGYPQVFPARRPSQRPQPGSRDGDQRAGFYCTDVFSPVTAATWPAARAAAECALTAAALLPARFRLAYALCRPPGHMAERALFGGFCYVNNAAVAAHALSRRGRVALLDIDFHHGAGSQEIFYGRRDVLTLSIHGDPRDAFPYFSGFEDETGSGSAVGFNRNFPLPPGTGDAEYLATLDRALAELARFGPDFLVVSLGYDIMRGDPTGSFLVTPSGMGAVGLRLGRLALPTLVVQEGGYPPFNLRRGARAFFLGLLGAQ